jgi:hypothetical protein
MVEHEPRVAHNRARLEPALAAHLGLGLRGGLQSAQPSESRQLLTRLVRVHVTILNVVQAFDQLIFTWSDPFGYLHPSTTCRSPHNVLKCVCKRSK